MDFYVLSLFFDSVKCIIFLFFFPFQTVPHISPWLASSQIRCFCTHISGSIPGSKLCKYFLKYSKRVWKVKFMKHYFKEVEESLLIPGLYTHSEDFLKILWDHEELLCVRRQERVRKGRTTREPAEGKALANEHAKSNRHLRSSNVFGSHLQKDMFPFTAPWRF